MALHRVTENSHGWTLTSGGCSAQTSLLPSVATVGAKCLCVPRTPSAALTSKFALPAARP